MQAQGGLSIERMCQLGPVSRAGFYRHWQRHEPGAEEMEVRARIQEVVLQHRGRYGYRRVSWQSKHQGLVVNHKRVLRRMPQVICLAGAGAEADILTHRRAGRLAGVCESGGAPATERHRSTLGGRPDVSPPARGVPVPGGGVGRLLPPGGGLGGGRLAARRLDHRRAAQGDCRASAGAGFGASFRSWHSVCRAGLRAAAARALHRAQHETRTGNPYDNAKCESFIRTRKQEEIYTREYRDRADLEAHIAEFLEQYYNRRRLHSALGYRSPEQFENSLRAGPGLRARSADEFF